MEQKPDGLGKKKTFCHRDFHLLVLRWRMVHMVKCEKQPVEEV